MKGIILILLVLAALAPATSQGTTPLPLQIKDARTMGMGGAFTALSSGYQSLFGNPAGFGYGKAKLTLANATMWGYVKPSGDNINKVMSLVNQESSDYIGLAEALLVDNGIGFGASAGLGLVGGGLGIGATAVGELYARGNTLSGTGFRTSLQYNAVLGLAIPIGSDRFGLKVGGDLRPFMRIDADNLTALDLVGAMGGDGDPMAIIMGQDANYGVGVAADLGAILNWGALSAGLVLRDLAPPFSFTPTTLEKAIGGEVEADAEIKSQFLPNITFGLGWSPRLIPLLLEPSFYLEVQDPLNAAKGNAVWNLLHLGAEVKVLSFIYFRGGLSQGYLTAGTGINLLILQIDGAVFTEEFGAYPGDKPRSGFALNARLHL